MRIPSKEDILRSLVEKAKELYPNNLWVPGLPHTDFSITIPLEEAYRSYILSLYVFFLSSEKGIQVLLSDETLQSSLKSALGMTDDEFSSMLRADIVSRFYGLEPLDGSPSYGVVRCYLYEDNITIPSPDSIYFLDSDGREYRPIVYGKFFASTEDETGRMYVDFPSVSVGLGSEYNVPSGSIIAYRTSDPSIRDKVVSVRNITPFSYGRSSETLQEFVSRVSKWKAMKLGMSFLPYLEQLLLSNGARRVRFRSIGDEHYYRGWGVDAWVDISAPLVSVEYSGGTIYDPVITVNGNVSIPDPKNNAYSLSIYQNSSLLNGDVYEYNPVVRSLQGIVQESNIWWFGGRAVLVRMAFPVKLHLSIVGKINPGSSVDDIKSSVSSLIAQNYGIGDSVYISKLVEWMMENGLDYAQLDTLSVVADYPSGSVSFGPDDVTIPLEFYQYALLEEVVINEL